MEKASRFSFAVVSNNKRAPKTTTPQVILTPTKGTFKFNEAASRLLSLSHGDHAAFLNNEADVQAAIANGDLEEGAPVQWAVMKGYTLLDANGVAKKAVKRLSDEEKAALIEAGEVDDDGEVITQYEDKKLGFKLASNTKSAGIGVVLTGNDSANYPLLGGNTEESVIYDIEVEPAEIEIDGEVRKVYLLGDKSTQPKVVRGK